MSDLAEVERLFSDIVHLRAINRLKYYEPYPWQIEFHNAEGYLTPGQPASQRAAICANKVGKCSSVRSLIETVAGPKEMGAIWGRDVEVLAYPGKLPRRVVAWVKKPAERCYRITMSDGRWFECPSEHLILTDGGFLPISRILPFLPKYVVHAVDFRSGVRKGARRLMGTLRGCWDRCFADFRLRGGRLLSDEEGVLVCAPLPSGVPGRSLLSLRWGALVDRCTNSALRVFGRLSNSGAGRLISVPCAVSSGPASNTGYRLSADAPRMLRRSGEVEHLASASFGKAPSQWSLSSSRPQVITDCGNRIISVDDIGVHPLYDMQVEGGCYTAAGLIHHNTLAAAMEVAMHATGIYPDWFKGTRYLSPPEILVCGLTNDSVRDLGQRELLGDPTDEKALGTGTIPKLKIGKRRLKTGVPNAYDSVRVQHVSSGWSRIYFRAYEQGWKKFQGIAFEVAWPDEEPPIEIWSQLLRATLARRKAIIFCTMTPEEGMTEVVTGFMENLQKGQALITATWDDAKHLTPEVKAQRLAALRPHERDMRSKGIPLQGAGLIFPVSDEQIVIDPIEIPRHWPQLIGVDFGISTQHPFSAANLVWDRDADCIYLTHEYQTTDDHAAVHADAIKAWGSWKPVAWPHDGLNREKGTGDELQDVYRKKGLNLLPWKATNAPTIGQVEGEGGNSPEKAVLEMLDRMYQQRWKVFRTCTTWLKEKRMYHRDLKGKIVRLHEDLICASRYASMMIRHARTMSVLPARRDSGAVGIRQW